MKEAIEKLIKDIYLTGYDQGIHEANQENISVFLSDWKDRFQDIIKEANFTFGENMTEVDKLQAVSYWFIKQCEDTNAKEMTVKQKGVTRFGKPLGDWEIKVKSLVPPIEEEKV